VKCLAAITKLVASFDGQELLGVVQGSPLLGYLAGFLSCGVPAVAGLALILTDLLLEKMPSLALVRPRSIALGIVSMVYT
jgi:hypothetical protein